MPASLKDANDFVERVHRHHGKVQGHKFSLAAVDHEGQVRAVAIVGRPVSRVLDDGWTLEVTRLASDGYKNACSLLYAAAWRAARALGFRRMVTYVLSEESGHTLKAAGWQKASLTRWNQIQWHTRTNRDIPNFRAKRRWQVVVSGDYPEIKWNSQEGVD